MSEGIRFRIPSVHVSPRTAKRIRGEFEPEDPTGFRFRRRWLRAVKERFWVTSPGEEGDALATHAAGIGYDRQLVEPEVSRTTVKGTLEHELELTERKISEYQSSPCRYASEIMENMFAAREKILQKLGRPIPLH